MLIHEHNVQISTHALKRFRERIVPNSLLMKRLASRTEEEIADVMRRLMAESICGHKAREKIEPFLKYYHQPRDKSKMRRDLFLHELTSVAFVVIAPSKHCRRVVTCFLAICKSCGRRECTCSIPIDTSWVRDVMVEI